MSKDETQIYDGGAVCGDGVPGGAGESDRAGNRVLITRYVKKFIYEAEGLVGGQMCDPDPNKTTLQLSYW